MTPESNRNLSVRRTVKISDLDIIYGFVNSPVWKLFFSRYGLVKMIGLTIAHYFKFFRALLSLSHWSVIHFRAGSQTIGLLALLAALCLIIGFNSVAVTDYNKLFAVFITPYMLCSTPVAGWFDFIVLRVESQFLLIYGGLVLLSSLFHIIMIWIGKGNLSMSKRGESYLVLLLSRKFPVNEYFICGIVEPLFSVGLAALLWFQFDDMYGAVFLAAAALSEAMQQVLDQAQKQQLKSIIQT